MTAPVPGPAPWAGLHHLPLPVQPLHPPDVWSGWLRLATDVLWAATGRRWRGESRTETAAVDTGDVGWCPDLRELHPHRHRRPPARVQLPRLDVTAVTAVTLDGSPFTPWRLEGQWLVRTDGRAWPGRERVHVTYTHGRPVPIAGRVACAEYAAELGKSTAPSHALDDAGLKCSLPERVQSVTRQGITFAALDDMEFLEQGLTGLYAVDAWIRSVNPAGRRSAGRVWSPQQHVARRLT